MKTRSRPGGKRGGSSRKAAPPENRVLVVDSNKVYANLVRDVLLERFGIEADVVTNVWELNRRLRINGYRAIVADLYAASDAEEMRGALTEASCPKLLWNCGPSEKEKPSNKRGIISAISEFAKAALA